VDHLDFQIANRSQTHWVENLGNGFSRIVLSESYVQGLEAGRLAANPDDRQFVTVIQFLAVKQLINNLVGLSYIADHEVAPPQIPQELSSRLQALRFPDTLTTEIRRSINEPKAREAILKAYDELAGEIPDFS